VSAPTTAQAAAAEAAAQLRAKGFATWRRVRRGDPAPEIDLTPPNYWVPENRDHTHYAFILDPLQAAYRRRAYEYLAGMDVGCSCKAPFSDQCPANWLVEIANTYVIAKRAGLDPETCETCGGQMTWYGTRHVACESCIALRRGVQGVLL
jgi:hypothetical protein